MSRMSARPRAGRAVVGGRRRGRRALCNSLMRISFGTSRQSAGPSPNTNCRRPSACNLQMASERNYTTGGRPIIRDRGPISIGNENDSGRRATAGRRR
ncbi:hypothetical protein EVAR_91540_1 [Eumeta japonica]|uniref:Uncharacterized protein n=1 Tax=Eumeta variegata TaxID=151549 RepID=A0A4C1VA75_EUMVA|nr:hypothetical protein EVAR_91540_1 [Eumeta japonica]